MFSFHKPRVYRSTQGCCICKAKSSSSRFTDSKKYETDFMKCFQLTTPRHGEICNACVLLVKRFKRLPTGSDRHWGHVVDARVGPGLKSMTKFKKRKEESLQQKLLSDHNNVKSQSSRISIPEKFSKIFKKSKKKKFIEKREETPGSSDEQSLPPPSPTSFNNSDSEENQFRVRHKSSNNRANTIRTNLKKINKRKARRPSRNFKHFENINFFDEQDWVCIKSCCGIVYENRQIGALMIDYETCVPCVEHKNFYIPTTTINRLSVGSDKKTENQQISNNNNHNFTIQSNNTSHNSVTIYKQHETNNNNISMSLPALKKHHLFLKRQMENGIARLENSVPNLYKTESCSVTTTATEHVENVSDVLMSTEILTNTNNHSSNIINKQLTYLHKTKSDAGKIIKHSLDKITNARLKPSDLNVVKNLVKICTEKSIKIKPTDDKIDAIPRNKQIDPTANKFSDNSSDSGYEENLQEQKIASAATIQQVHKGKLQSVVRPVILANGIKLHVQPQNLVLAANLAGISQSAMQQPHAQIANKITSQTDTDGNRAIYNISSPSSLSPPSSSSPLNDGLAVSITGASAITQMVHTIPAGTNLNQKIILVKAKYNNSGNQAAANN